MGFSSVLPVFLFIPKQHLITTKQTNYTRNTLIPRRSPVAGLSWLATSYLSKTAEHHLYDFT